MDATLIDLLGGPPGNGVDPVTRRLVDLYLGGVTVERAAAATGLDVDEASRRLRAKGVAGPPSLRPPGPPPELLADLYLGEGLTIAAVAARLGLTPGQARYHLRRAGIRRPEQGRARTKPRLDVGELEDLYVRRQLTIRAIAALVGLDQRDVWRQLTEAGIPRRPRGTGRVAAVGREALEELYVGQGLTVEATARRLGVTPKTVRRHLAAGGILLRDKQRRPPPRRLLERLYVAERLSPRQIADRLGLTLGQVRYDLVRLGIPLRSSGRLRRTT